MKPVTTLKRLRNYFMSLIKSARSDWLI